MFAYASLQNIAEQGIDAETCSSETHCVGSGPGVGAGASGSSFVGERSAVNVSEGLDCW